MSATVESPSRVRERLLRDGFCPVGARVPSGVLAAAHATGRRLLASESDESRRAMRSLGSLISVFRDPAFEPLITEPTLTGLLDEVGGGGLRFSAGYFLSKPAGSPATFWHQDWGFWHDPVSYTATIAEIGVLLYLVDVDETNGCPRFLPGSHRRRHPTLHDLLATTDVADLRRADDPSTLAYQAQDGAVAVPVRAGEAVLFDPRVLHGAHANQTTAERPALVLWYYCDYLSLDPSVRAFIADGDPLAAWPAEARSRLARWMPEGAPGVLRSPLTKHPDERLR